MSCLDYSGVPSVDKIDGQFATAHGLPVTIVIETDKQGNKVLVNSAQVQTPTVQSTVIACPWLMGYGEYNTQKRLCLVKSP